MEKLSVKSLFDSAVHFGHKTQKWNPRMAKYIHGDMNGIHVFDLNQTVEALGEACEFLKSASQEGKNILFVSTKPQSTKIVVDAAKKTGMFYVVKKWVPGLLTNFSTLSTRIKYLKELKEKRESGELEKYTKKEASGLVKTIAKLEDALGGVEDMTKKPDVLVVIDAMRDQIAVKEALNLKIPVVAICDSNANPDSITYPVPGNDDSVKSLEFLIGAFAAAIVEGASKKKSS